MSGVDRGEVERLLEESRARSEALRGLAADVLALRDDRVPGTEATRDAIGRVEALLVASEARIAELRRLAGEVQTLRARLAPWAALGDRLQRWRERR
ncbi:MAG TPA: hypothetical protein VLA75_07965 [Thermoanaerobaculia bacterium]|nr:hypothetical protein [Thermoanaerobaculia bacterium]